MKNVGREPQPGEPKLLVPLVQAAALETDESLAEKWAVLLDNAADSAQRVAVRPAFVEVLRQLIADDAEMLRYIHAEKYTIALWDYISSPIYSLC